jgi:hypothetical protein
MLLTAAIDMREYEADLAVDDDGIWTATIWLVSENGSAKNLMAYYVDVECPAVGDQFRKANQ